MVPIAGRRATARPARAESRCLSMTGGFGSPAAACSIASLKVIRERRTVDIGAGSTTREGSSLIAHSCLRRWHLHLKQWRLLLFVAAAVALIIVAFHSAGRGAITSPAAV